MSAWARDSTGCLVSVESNESKMTDFVSHPVLMDGCYPPRSSHPSCSRLPEASEKNYELKSQNITMLPKFSLLESEDGYMFISEFEKVWVMMKIQQLSDDAVKLRFIPFKRRDNTKKWIYSLETNSITIWAEFVAVFLKFFPMHKTERIQSEINQFRQREKKPFGRYLDRLKDLLAQCLHHAIEKCRLCQIIYEGVDCQSQTLLESMSHGNFMRMTENDA